jgi:Zn-dependent oligopeptidase
VTPLLPAQKLLALPSCPGLDSLLRFMPQSSSVPAKAPPPPPPRSRSFFVGAFSLILFTTTALILAAPRITPRFYSALHYVRPAAVTATYSTYRPVFTQPPAMADRYKSPPQAPPTFTGTKESIVEDMKRICSKTRSMLDKLVADVPAEKATFENIMLPQALDENEMALSTNILTFYSAVSADSELRDASTEAEKYMNEFSIEIGMREDVFNLVKAVYESQGGKEGVAAGGSKKDMDKESARLLEREYKSYIKNGLGLPVGEKRDRFKEIKKRLSELQVNFQKNLNEENGGIWFTKEQLAGVPADVVDILEKGTGENEGKFRMTFKYPDLFPTMKFALDDETRRKMFIGNENRVGACSMVVSPWHCRIFC